MSTTDLSPLHEPVDDPPLSDPEPRELDSGCLALAPSTNFGLLAEQKLATHDGGGQTFVLNLNALGQKYDDKSTPVDELSIDDSRFPPASRGLPENNPPSSLGVDSNAAVAEASRSPTSDGGDPANINTPIQPPGLSLPVDDDPPVEYTPAQADEVAVSAVEDGERRSNTSSCFSLSGLETLRTLIPHGLLPDDLLVYDPDNLTSLGTGKSQLSLHILPLRYVRIFPKTSREDSMPQDSAACADKSPQPAGDRPEDNKLGAGNHGSVYSAPFTRLRRNAESGEESTVRVAVKAASTKCGSHEMLRREAVAYDAFPRDLMEGTYAPASPQDVGVAQPDTEPGHDTTQSSTSTSDDTSTSADGADRPRSSPSFFGYYAPVDADGSVIDNAHPDCDIDSDCAITWPTCLLLIEECGRRIVLEEGPLEERTRCLELFKRLHAAGFTQGSVYSRNILIEPGPLSAPPEERSDETPGFRIIDFGRMQMLGDFSPESEESFEESREGSMLQFLGDTGGEDEDAEIPGSMEVSLGRERQGEVNVDDQDSEEKAEEGLVGFGCAPQADSEGVTS
ncbi:hypothetical protein V8D89_000195 [Ganoderma adspersum]